ncbi:hypothetical protein J1N35_029164 [Gossypium stocksii]|uniref:CCHC-type domain-containing protein n=1 Tax=Gossypium stocksii TaxID=47602 RepID=A0A9D3ZT39_9ROSI|nr:hypothetical protein J1N35_029164 [Gossypium stocksii]
MAEDINEMIERLKFSEEESNQVISINTRNTYQGYESWVVGKIMAEVKAGREVMYSVFRSLWFTKEEINFIALKEEVIIVKFRCLEDRSRILNLIPWLFDNCLFSMLPFIKVSWKRRSQNNIVLKYERLPDFCYFCGLIGHTIKRCKNKGGDPEATDKNLLYGRWMRANIVTLNQGRATWQNRVERVTTDIPSNEDRELAKLTQGMTMGNKLKKMDSCLTVDAIGMNRGLALVWREDARVDIKNYSKNHINSLIHLDNENTIRFTGFYWNVDDNNRNSSWEILKRLGRIVMEK